MFCTISRSGEIRSQLQKPMGRLAHSILAAGSRRSYLVYEENISIPAALSCRLDVSGKSTFGELRGLCRNREAKCDLRIGANRLDY